MRSSWAERKRAGWSCNGERMFQVIKLIIVILNINTPRRSQKPLPLRHTSGPMQLPADGVNEAAPAGDPADPMQIGSDELGGPEDERDGDGAMMRPQPDADGGEGPMHPAAAVSQEKNKVANAWNTPEWGRAELLLWLVIDICTENWTNRCLRVKVNSLRGGKDGWGASAEQRIRRFWVCCARLLEDVFPGTGGFTDSDLAAYHRQMTKKPTGRAKWRWATQNQRPDGVLCRACADNEAILAVLLFMQSALGIPDEDNDDKLQVQRLRRRLEKLIPAVAVPATQPPLPGRRCTTAPCPGGRRGAVRRPPPCCRAAFRFACPR